MSRLADRRASTPWIVSTAWILSAVATAAFASAAALQAQPVGEMSDMQLLLESSGIDAALLDQFADGVPAAQVALLSGLRQVSPLELDRFAAPATSAADLDAAGRGKLWTIRGTLTSIEQVELTDEQWRTLYGEIDNLPPDDPRRFLYRCEIRLDGPSGGAAAERTATVVSMQIPRQLVGRDELDERVGVQGLLVKDAGDADHPHPVFYARRLAWYPHGFLGDLGMDFALYDDVRRVANDLKQERECFYQLLATMRKADFGRLSAEAVANYDADAEQFSVAPLFGTADQPDLPRTMRGKLATIVGTARRAVAVVVNDADIQERFGIKQYYEVSIYTSDSQQNPLIVNLVELPAGCPQGEGIHAEVRVPASYLTGFYYNRDATPDEKARGVKPNLQKAPLLIGKTLEVLPPPHVEGGIFEWLFGASVAAAFVVLTLGVWRLMRGEHRTREILQRQMAPESGSSLNDLDVEYQAKPDFSGLDVPESPPKPDAGPPPA